jgi:PII-like signaling protein
MNLLRQAERLRIFLSESDRCDGRLLYEAIVEEARRQGLAGATVLRGVSGFGANSRVHTNKILRLSEDLPVVEVVDTPEKIEAFLPWLDQVMREGLVTLEGVQVMFYRHNQGKKN